MQSANFRGDKCANGPHTNFSLPSSILQNINFAKTSLWKIFNDLLNFFETVLHIFQKDIIVVFLIILIQSLDEKIGAGWQPPPTDGKSQV